MRPLACRPRAHTLARTCACSGCMTLTEGGSLCVLPGVQLGRSVTLRARRTRVVSTQPCAHALRCDGGVLLLLLQGVVRCCT